jgi:hypothetical protein
MQGMPKNKKKNGECEELASRERAEGQEIDVEEASNKPRRGCDKERNI